MTPRFTRRALALAAAASCLSLPDLASAQGSEYPTRPIELVVPYPAGGGTDVLARAFAQVATKYLSQPLIVINKSGAAGAIGWSYVTSGHADGYRIVILATDLVVQANMGYTKITYRDFAPIARLNFDPAGFSVKADSPWNSVAEVLAAAKKGGLSVGNGGTGGAYHLAAAALEKQAGVEFTHIPYQGAGPSALALLGGHIQATTIAGAEVWPYVTGGKVKILGMMSETRTEGYENIPTLKEQGYDIQLGAFRGLAAHKDTPPAIMATLRQVAAKVAADPQFKDALKKQNMGYAYADGPAFQEALAKDHAFYAELIEKAGLKPKP